LLWAIPSIGSLLLLGLLAILAVLSMSRLLLIHPCRLQSDTVWYTTNNIDEQLRQHLGILAIERSLQLPAKQHKESPGVEREVAGRQKNKSRMPRINRGMEQVQAAALREYNKRQERANKFAYKFTFSFKFESQSKSKDK